MRLIALAAALATLATPALAQTALTDQLLSANQLFAASLDNDGFADGKYYEAMINDIGGSWIEASALMTPDVDPAKLAEYLSTTCDRFPTAITAPAPLTIRMTLVTSKLQVPTTYVYLGGASFAATSDVVAVLTRTGVLDRMKEMPRIGVNAMSYSNGVFGLFRVSPDVIAITSEMRPPRLLARCSSVTPAVAAQTGPDDDAFKEAIGKAFDDQFGSNADPSKRQAFIDCAIKVFAPLSADDRKIVIATNFNPPSPDRERIEAGYPGLAAGATACAEAADNDALP